MSNSATPLSAIPSFDKRLFVSSKITPVIANIDTINTALEIKDVTSATNYLAIVGCQYVAAEAHTLTILSDATEIATYDLAANDGIMFAVGDHPGAMLIAKQGEALNVKSSANIGKIIFYIAELVEKL